ncbi:ABC transporter ATP-binding protein [Fodinibius salsisoli]|uniref:ATP-binding cassette domain-containing protein n=1 Tax=Fodinibius salsisoli TaxID=2820877 RepID=A0ABT3PMR5_9BACT|nr:ATP-binding cassette domain-containing protein [Fodinibius salsisoli]MCW9707238.1 ATP-binding cassette domain-containing protein [Fodinibius salsisoli]
MKHRDEQVPILEFNNVIAYRNDTKVMDQFSMRIDQLQHTAILGPNGAGKSTFIQLLTHQLHPLATDDDTPPIRVFGKDHWVVSELRKRIGIVSPEMEYEILHNLKHGRTNGRGVVITGFFSSMQLFAHHSITDEMKRKADRTLEMMDAGYLADRMFNRMSTGEARRVLIARALVTDPDVLVLDEPTTALDPVAREKCLQWIRNIAQQGTSVIIVTHHIEEIIPEINNIVLLRDGKTIASGPKDKVLTSKKLSTVYGHPLRLKENNNGHYIELNQDAS